MRPRTFFAFALVVSVPAIGIACSADKFTSDDAGSADAAPDLISTTDGGADAATDVRLDAPPPKFCVAHAAALLCEDFDPTFGGGSWTNSGAACLSVVASDASAPSALSFLVPGASDCLISRNVTLAGVPKRVTLDADLRLDLVSPNGPEVVTLGGFALVGGDAGLWAIETHLLAANMIELAYVGGTTLTMKASGPPPASGWVHLALSTDANGASVTLGAVSVSLPAAPPPIAAPKLKTLIGLGSSSATKQQVTWDNVVVTVQ